MVAFRVAARGVGFITAILLSACVSQTRWEVSATQKKMLEIQPGMTKAQVVAILGTPNSREMIPDKEGQPIDFFSTRHGLPETLCFSPQRIPT